MASLNAKLMFTPTMLDIFSDESNQQNAFSAEKGDTYIVAFGLCYSTS